MIGGKIQGKTFTRDEREINGKMHISVRKSAELLGCCRSTMDNILNKARQGKLKPSFSWYRDTPRSPIWINKESLEDWAKQRGEMHT